METKARASGPLWASATDVLDGEISISEESSVGTGRFENNIPVRIIPGHGKVVPVEDVNAILAAYLSAGTGERWQTNLKDAIDKAIGGAM